MPPQETNSDLRGVRVLLLEDDALINMNTVELLEKMGCEADGYLHLDEAWEAAHRKLPDVAVLDVNLHDTATSFDLADWLHEQSVPIVFLTGYSFPAPSGKWQDASQMRKAVRP